MHFSEGIWTYLGRTQYATGHLIEARQSLERALVADPKDHLARVYLGLALLRSADRTRGLAELRMGLQNLRDWLEYIVQSRPFEPYWDPDGGVRSEVLKTIALAAQEKVDEAQLIAAVERVGAEFEEEIERARCDESRQRD